MFFLLRMLRARRGRTMDPLQVSMTGVRMGERFLQIGCDDRSLLSGLAAKVGLSGMAAVATFDVESEKRAAGVGAKIGTLIEVRRVEGSALPFDSDDFDMIVIDDTRGSFAAVPQGARAEYLADARRVVRQGGRVELVEGLSGGMFGGSIARPPAYDARKDFEAAGFKPVRVLAEQNGYRFVEALRPSTFAEATADKQL